VPAQRRDAGQRERLPELRLALEPVPDVELAGRVGRPAHAHDEVVPPVGDEVLHDRVGHVVLPLLLLALDGRGAGVQVHDDPVVHGVERERRRAGEEPVPLGVELREDGPLERDPRRREARRPGVVELVARPLAGRPRELRRLVVAERAVPVPGGHAGRVAALPRLAPDDGERVAERPVELVLDAGELMPAAARRSLLEVPAEADVRRRGTRERSRRQEAGQAGRSPRAESDGAPTVVDSRRLRRGSCGLLLDGGQDRLPERLVRNGHG
jgi:hypothetical protein